jgi:hypothetical protein
MWESRRLITLQASTACYRDGLTFYPEVELYENLLLQGDRQTDRHENDNVWFLRTFRYEGAKTQ